MNLKTKSLKYLKIAVILLAVFLYGLYIFWPAFKDLGVYGDTFWAYYNARIDFEFKNLQGSWITYFNPYGFSHIFVYLIDKLFGFDNSFVLYFISFIFRLLAGVSLFVFLKGRKISDGISAFAVLVFMASPIGLEAYEWAFQSVSYLSILFLVFGLAVIFKPCSLQTLLLFLLFFFLSVVTNPIRASGIIGTYCLILLGEVLTAKKKRKGFILLSLVLSLLLTFFLAKKYTSGDVANSNRLIFENGVKLISEALDKRSPDFFLNYWTSIGNILIPEYFINQYQNMHISSFVFGKIRPKFEGLLLLSIALGVLIIWKSYLFKTKPFKIIFSLSVLCLALLVLIADKYFSIFDYPFLVSFLLAIIFVLALFLFAIFDFYKKDLNQFRIDLVILSLTTLFVIVPWIRNPETILSSFHRYHVHSSLVIPIFSAFFLTSLVKIVKRVKAKSIFVLVSILLIFIPYALLTTRHLKDMVERHGRDYMKKVWSNLDTYLGGIDFSNKKTVFYFIADKPQKVYDSIGYCFGPHVGLIYGIWKSDNLPMTLSDLNDLKSMLKDGEASKRYIGQKYVYSPEDVFIFKIEGTKVTKLGISDICEDCL